MSDGTFLVDCPCCKARIEVDKSNVRKILAEHLKIAKYFKKIGFKFVVLDLEGYRTGSLNPNFNPKK